MELISRMYVGVHSKPMEKTVGSSISE